MIREYTPSDIVFIEEIGKVIDSNYKFKINQYTKCLVYIDENIIVGFINYFLMYEKAEITDIAVKEEYRLKHIGSQLLNKVVSECVANGCDSLSLEVRATNTDAITFYKKNGFREISVRKNYYSNGEDALMMVKML